MAKELGIGVRVWVGWCPDEHVGTSTDARCKTGTIVEGPFLKGDVVQKTESGERIRMRETAWNVDLDGGGSVGAEESILHPIDDGDPDAVRERQEKPEEVGA